MALKKKLMTLVITLLLTSCSSDTSFEKDNFTEILNMYFNYDDQKNIKKFTRNEVSKIDYPLIEIRTNGILLQALMLPLSIRDGFYNYSSGSGQSLTMKGAMILRTNGLNLGFISLKTNQNPLFDQTPLTQWPKKQSKEYVFLRADFSSYTISFECNFIILKKEEITIVENKYFLTKILDKCSSKKTEFTNIYWVDETGFVWKSKQWISPKNIFAEISIINR